MGVITNMIILQPMRRQLAEGGCLTDSFTNRNTLLLRKLIL